MLSGPVQARNVASVGMNHARNDVGRAHPQVVELASGVDVGDDHVVGVGEAGGEFAQQGFGAALGMGLEDSPDGSLRIASPSCPEGSSYLGRMVGVIVNDNYSIHFALHLKAPLHPAIASQRLPHPCQVQALS